MTLLKEIFKNTIFIIGVRGLQKQNRTPKGLSAVLDEVLCLVLAIVRDKVILC